MSNTLSNAKPLGVADLTSAVNRHAPILFLYPGETHFPSSVEWFLERITVHDPDTGSTIESPDEFDLPIPGKSAFMEIHGGMRNSGRVEDARLGNLGTAHCYAQAISRGSETEIHYWMFIPYRDGLQLETIATVFRRKSGRGISDLSPIGQRIGNWITIAIRIDNATLSVTGARFHDAAPWLTDRSLFECRGVQVVGYLSRSGREIHAKPDTRRRRIFRLDLWILSLRVDSIFTAGSGSQMDFSGRCDLISAPYLGSAGPVEPSWLRYEGTWGPRAVPLSIGLEPILSVARIGWAPILLLVLITGGAALLIGLIVLVASRSRLRWDHSGSRGPKQLPAWGES